MDKKVFKKRGRPPSKDKGLKKPKPRLTRKKEITSEQKIKLDVIDKEGKLVKQELLKIYQKTKENEKIRFHHLYKILCTESLLWASHDNLRRNAGSLTGGIDKDNTADKISEDRIRSISKSLTTETYEPKPVRRIYIPKPGKKKLRPLGIPNYTDKIVQDALRMILTSIYEPVFDKDDSNYGFRPGLGCSDAIKTIKDDSRGMSFAIEGDIEGAYDNVNFDILESILKEKIEDKKILRLIRKMFDAGYIDKNTHIRTEKGVPQGSIVSPLLFNIYASGLDNFVRNTLGTKFKELNTLEFRSDKSKKGVWYERFRSRLREENNKISRALKKYNDKYEDAPEDVQARVREMHKTRKRWDKVRRRMKTTRQNKTPLRFCYVRYADDWIIFNNWHKEGNEQIKQSISDYLSEKLQLKLSDEKTIITDITKTNTKFLGFTFKNLQATQKRSKYVDVNENLINRRITTDIFTGIDSERVIKRLQLKNFLTNDKLPKPKRNALIQLLSTHEIVQKYKEIISGFVNYYYEHLSNASDLGRYHYYMYYSCLHTIAAREKSSITKTIYKYGKDIRIRFAETSLDEKYLKKQHEINKKMGIKEPDFKAKTTWKEIAFPKFNELRQQGEKLRNIHNLQDMLKNTRWKKKKLTKKDEETIMDQLWEYGINTIFKSTVEDELDYSLNTRTRKQLIKFCPMCKKEASDLIKLEAHHITPLKKVKKKTLDPFEDFMRDINRLQVPLCQQCHKRVHSKGWATASYAEHEKFKEAIKDIENLNTTDRLLLYND